MKYFLIFFHKVLVPYQFLLILHLFSKQKKFLEIYRGVVQLASMLAWGASGRAFESRHSDFQGLI